ncbi:MAG: S8 family serine peptidase [Pseudomonadota bacterium]
MRLSRELIGDLLLRGRAGPRFLYDSAIQIDVWAAYGASDTAIVDLLLTPMEHLPAARLASLVARRIADGAVTPRASPQIFPLEGFVAIRADKPVFLHYLVPMTALDLHAGFSQLHNLVEAWANDPARHDGRPPPAASGVMTVGRLLAFAAANRSLLSPELRLTLLHVLLAAPDPDGEADTFAVRSLAELADVLAADETRAPAPDAIDCRDRLIWQIARNRPVDLTGSSIETVKADAVRRLFQTSADHLVWAVIDSGIDGSHPAFRDHKAGGFRTRIVKAYDFSRLRALASYDALSGDPDPDLVERLKQGGIEAAKIPAWLDDLREDARRGRPFDWAVLEKLLETKSDRLEPVGADGKPVGHGTHVAGVLAGDWRENDVLVYQGVVPDLRLYDLRILGSEPADTEFAVIAALEFVRWLNARNRYMTVHGVNMSLGLVHDVLNFACGQTPVCRAADATVRAGVVVVVAAGNWGHQEFLTALGSYKGYAPASIADPGNADCVITVGATHRDRPHEYGVSFFSSRGPTGDGRRKPDLVAPGEKIEGPLPNLGLGTLDGTSMAAPHVSGVAALLMARHPELVGQPDTVKQVLCETATDLGRERDFQGAGLVDALRALQAR